MCRCARSPPRAFVPKPRAAADSGRHSVGLRIRVIVVRPPERREVATEVQLEVARNAMTDVAYLGTARLRTGPAQRREEQVVARLELGSRRRPEPIDLRLRRGQSFTVERGFADWNTTTFTDGSDSRSVIRAPNSTIVAGTNILIGALLKVTVHRPGRVRSALNCEGSGMARLLRRLADQSAFKLTSRRDTVACRLETSTAQSILGHHGGLLRMCDGICPSRSGVQVRPSSG